MGIQVLLMGKQEQCICVRVMILCLDIVGQVRREDS